MTFSQTRGCFGKGQNVVWGCRLASAQHCSRGSRLPFKVFMVRFSVLSIPFVPSTSLPPAAGAADFAEPS